MFSLSSFSTGIFVENDEVVLCLYLGEVNGTCYYYFPRNQCFAKGLPTFSMSLVRNKVFEERFFLKKADVKTLLFLTDDDTY